MPVSVRRLLLILPNAHCLPVQQCRYGYRLGEIQQVLSKMFQAAHLGNEIKKVNVRTRRCVGAKHCCMCARLVPLMQKDCADVEGSHIQEKMAVIVGQSLNSENSHGGQNIHMFRIGV